MSPCQQWVSEITYEQHRLAKRQNIDEGRSEMMKHGGALPTLLSHFLIMLILITHLS